MSGIGPSFSSPIVKMNDGMLLLNPHGELWLNKGTRATARRDLLEEVWPDREKFFCSPTGNTKAIRYGFRARRRVDTDVSGILTDFALGFTKRKMKDKRNPKPKR